MPRKKNIKLTKIIFSILAIVLIITLSELGYFLFYKKGALNLQFSPNVMVNRQSPSPTPQEKDPRSSKLVSYQKVQNFLDTLYVYLVSERESLIKKANLTLELKGIVDRSGFETGEIDGKQYDYVIRLTSPDGKKMLYRYTANEIEKAKVYFVTPRGKEKFQLSLINPGDTITIIEHTNLLDFNPYLELIFEVEKDGQT